MKQLILLLTLLATVTGYCQAQTKHDLSFLNYKNSTDTEYSQVEFVKAWRNTATCIKNGSKIIAVNKVFKANNYGYRDCSSSKQAQLINKKLGRSILVFKLAYLPDAVIKLLKDRKLI